MGIGHAQREKISPLKEYARFGITGVLNTGIDFAVLNALLLAFGPLVKGGVYAIYKTISFLAALVNSYFMNKYWVFSLESKTGYSHKEGARFFLVSAGGFVLNVILSSIIFHIFSESFSSRIAGNVGAIVGTAVVLVWNYVGYKFFVFISRS